MNKASLVLVLVLLGIWLSPGRHSSFGAVESTNPAHFWPQWRGPLATGVAPHGDPPIAWSETENVRWKVAIPGKGQGTPIVWDDRVYVLTAIEMESKPQAEKASTESGSTGGRPRGIQPASPIRFVTLALDRATGEVVWERTARIAVPHEGTHRTATWAGASAVTDGVILISSFGSNGIYAYDLDGELKWRKDLGDMRTRNAFGEGSSPAMWGDTVVVNWDHEGDSFIVALDRLTGKERWRRERDEPTSWSTPLIVDRSDRPQAIVNATNRARSYDLATGEVIWEVGGMTVNTIPTPVHAGGLVYLMSGFRGNSLLAVRIQGATGDLTGSEKAIAWSYQRDTPYVPSPLLYEDSLYFLKSLDGILSNLDPLSGAVHFGPERLDGITGVYASPVGASGRVYIAGQEGATLVLRRGPKLEVLAKNQLDDGFDASPAIAGSQLFLRGREYLYCLEER